MRKQGFMKRVLGGIMAVAFGAALCFAAPMKAEAALPPGWAPQGMYTAGNYYADQGRAIADDAADAVQYYIGAQQYYLNRQLAARTNIAQTTASAKMYLAALESGLKGLSLVPEAYRVPVATAIYQQQGKLRNDAIGFINQNYVVEAKAKEDQAIANAWMNYYMGAQVYGLQMVQAGMAFDATARALNAQYNAYESMQRQLSDQYDAAYYNMLAAMGMGGPNYGF